MPEVKKYRVLFYGGPGVTPARNAGLRPPPAQLPESVRAEFGARRMPPTKYWIQLEKRPWNVGAGQRLPGYRPRHPEPHGQCPLLSSPYPHWKRAFRGLAHVLSYQRNLNQEGGKPYGTTD